MRIDIITIFPKMFAPVLNESIVKRAQKKGKVAIHVHDLRDYTLDKHRKVDDRPFGGGSGMVICPEPIFKAVEEIRSEVGGRSSQRSEVRGRRSEGKALSSELRAQRAKVILLCPQGEKLTQASAKRLAQCRHLILICGHYEGIDERVRQGLVDEELSIGDYVLTGGELPAMVVIDSIVRLIPGVLGDKNSLNFESFEANLLEYPQYTRPAVFRKLTVPAVLVSGDHKKIDSWRRAQAVRITRKKRPDLYKTIQKKEKRHG